MGVGSISSYRSVTATLPSATESHRATGFRKCHSPTISRRFFDKNQARARDELFDLLRIPSVSARSEHNADTARAAEWVAESLRDDRADGHDPPDEGTPDRRRRMAQGAAGRADDARLRPLRRAAGRAARAVGQPAVRADGARRQDLRARLGRRQRPALSARQGARGAPRDARQASGQHHRPRRRARRKSAATTSRSSSRRTPTMLACDAVVISDSAMFAPGLPSILSSLRGLAYFQIDVQGPATDLHSGSYGGARDESRDGARAHSRHDARRRRRTSRSPASTTTCATGATSLASRSKQLPFDDEGISRRDGIAGAVRREGLHDARAAVDASDVRGERPAQRLHRRRREDGAAREGDGQGELSPRARSDAGGDRAADARARRARRAAGRRGDGDARSTAAARGAPTSTARCSTPRAAHSPPRSTASR